MYRIALLLVFCSCSVYGSDRERLFHSLMNSYVKDLKPDVKVLIRHDVSLINIKDYDDNILTANIYVTQSWNDVRLRWDPAMYNQTTKLVIPSRLLWIPDVVLYNNAGENAGLILNELNAIVFHTGEVTIGPQMRLVSQCTETGYIRKRISCQWKFGPWTYNGFDVDIRNTTQQIDLSNYSVNPGLVVVSNTARRNEVLYACCPEPYVDVTYTLQL